LSNGLLSRLLQATCANLPTHKVHFRARLLTRPSYAALLAAAAVLVSPAPAAAVLAGSYQYPVPWSEELVTYPFMAPAGSNRYHLADDVDAEAGTPVYADAAGTVVALENWDNAYNYGGLVLVAHDNSDGTQVVSLYGHLDGTNFTVEVGQAVARGSLLGYIGTPEQNGGWPEHLHHGIRKGGFLDYYAQSYSPFPYAGYGDGAEAANWENPTPYIAAHANVIEVRRIPESSPDRYATAAGVSAARFPAAQAATSVLLGSGTNFVDALAATSLVQYNSASLLLTKPDVLPDATKAELARVLAPGRLVTVLGGPKAVSDAVVAQVAAMGYATQRVDGRNRAATAVGVANLLPRNPARALIVNDASFADAVSAGGPAAASALPILLTKQDKLSPETRSYFEQHPEATTATILGGEAAVSSAVDAELRSIPTIKTVERLAGADRYETNVNTNTYLVGNPKALVVATGTNFADALAGGVLAATASGTLVLTKPGELPAPALAYITPARVTVEAGYVLGGAAAVDLAIDTSLAKLLNVPLAGTPATASVDAAQIPGLSATAIEASTWQGASVRTVDGVQLPVPLGFSTLVTDHNSAQVAAVAAVDPQQFEVPPSVVATRLEVPEGSSAAALVEETFGAGPIPPAFAPAYTTYVDHGSYVLVIEARGRDAAAVAAFVASLN